VAPDFEDAAISRAVRSGAGGATKAVDVDDVDVAFAGFPAFHSDADPTPAGTETVAVSRTASAFTGTLAPNEAAVQSSGFAGFPKFVDNTASNVASRTVSVASTGPLPRTASAVGSTVGGAGLGRSFSDPEPERSQFSGFPQPTAFPPPTASASATGGMIYNPVSGSFQADIPDAVFRSSSGNQGLDAGNDPNKQYTVC